MKALSIGRDMSCDIVLHDNTDVISRRHAILNITSSGKMTIVDQSRNGTYVNGIKVSANVPVPVTRKDVVSFAHVAQLDWSQIPRANSFVTYGAIALGVIFIILCCVFIPSLLPEGKNQPDVKPLVNQVDTATVKKDSKATEEAEKKENIKSDAEQKASGNDAQKKKKESKNKSAERDNKQKEKQNSPETDDVQKKDTLDKKQRPIGI